MIRVDHLSLPAGLRAIAQRTSRGELYIVVSDALDPAAQRAAVRAAVRAARRHAWEFGFLPLPVAAAVPALAAGLRHLFRVVRAHVGVSAITGTVAAGATMAAVLVLAAPHPAGHPGAIAPSSPGYSQTTGTGSGRSHPVTPAPRRSPGTAQRVITVGTPKATVPHPGPASQPVTKAAAPAQSRPPSASPAQPQPTTATSSSSPPPSGGGGGQTCVYLLGVLVCL